MVPRCARINPLLRVRPADADRSDATDRDIRHGMLYYYMAWTNWHLFTVGMLQRGHSDEDIRKILGLNVLRVLREVWPADLNKGRGA